jgi:hypothetical protein
VLQYLDIVQSINNTRVAIAENIIIYIGISPKGTKTSKNINGPSEEDIVPRM